MLTLLLALVIGQAPAERPRPFVVEVVDEETKRGVPLVELRTVNNILYVTDSNGLVAFDEPGLLGKLVFFSVRSYGYEFAKDGFGIRGRALQTEPGGTARLSVHRALPAERIYRVTGGGIYRDTILAGLEAPIHAPLLNAEVLGQDSVLAAIYGGKIHWFWGDTNRPGYPLGNFHTPGATSLLPSRGGLDPAVGVDLTYDPDEKGFARPSAKIEGEGPTWLSGLTVLRDPSGRERMFATFDKIRNMLQTYRRGLVEWDESKREFHPIAEVPLDAPLYPQGHPFLHTVNGVEYVYFASPFPLTRVRATPEAFLDLSQFEAFTPLKPGATAEAKEVERDANGQIVYGWKAGTAPARSGELDRLNGRKAMRLDESILPVRDVASTRSITPHGGSVNWNEFRKRWVAIFVESGGDSFLGEVHYAEADTPLGPWVYARKVATHSDGGLAYSFYNPKHHPFFDEDGGRTIFFEGTYANTFSGNIDQTPRYDYNQVMYKLDLGRPEMILPVPVYALSDAGPAGPMGTGGGDHPERHGQPVQFFAPDRPGMAETVPVYGAKTRAGSIDLAFGMGEGDPLFYAIPYGSKRVPLTTLPLLEFVHDDGIRHAYTTDLEWAAAGYRRTGQILGHVWRNPMKVVLPRE